MEKVKTYIKGFDELLDGGFPKNSIILVSGSPGTGKTIFGMEYIYNGAKKGEKGLYVSFEEKTDNLKKQIKEFGWDIDPLEKKGLMKIQYLPSRKIATSTLREILNKVKKNKIKRLVIDSISTLSLSIPTIETKVTEVTNFAIKRFIHQFLEDVRELEDTTTLIVSQTLTQSMLSSDEVSEFMADGIIHIIYESLGGEFSRSLNIRKMRQIKNDEDIHPLEIGKNGLRVHTLG